MKSTMLDAKEHSRIIADFEQVCTNAGIQGHFLYESMTDVCSERECDWVKKFWHYKAAGLAGLVLDGIKRPDTRCQAIAAALIRNYIDARVIPVNTLIDHMGNGGAPSPTVLIVPNLYVTALSKNVPAWRVQALYDLLLTRATQSRPTVVYVEHLEGLVGVYGVPFRDFLSRFLVVTESL